MNEMAEYYQSLKGYKRPDKPKNAPHKGNWSLVLHIGGTKQTIFVDKPYAMCVAKKKQVERDPRRKIG